MTGGTGGGGAGVSSTASSTSATTATSSTTGETATVSSTSGGLLVTCQESEPCDVLENVDCVTRCKADDPCDCDGDGFMLDSAACRPAGMSDAIDCYDCNPKAHPGQTDFFVVDRGDGNFDYDCDEMKELKYLASCAPTTPCMGEAFLAGVKCGETGSLFVCTDLVGACTPSGTFTPNVVQGCH